MLARITTTTYRLCTVPESISFFPNHLSGWARSRDSSTLSADEDAFSSVSCSHSADEIEWSRCTNNGCVGEEQSFIIQRGYCIDRFGSPYGSYFGACGNTYSERSLPYIGASPLCRSEYDSIYNSPDDPKNNYNQYEVLKSFPVKKCIASSCCGHLGGAEQYRVEAIPGFPDDNPNVVNLINRGFLRENPRGTYLPPKFGLDPLTPRTAIQIADTLACYKTKLATSQ